VGRDHDAAVATFGNGREYDHKPGVVLFVRDRSSHGHHTLVLTTWLHRRVATCIPARIGFGVARSNLPLRFCDFGVSRPRDIVTGAKRVTPPTPPSISTGIRSRPLL